MSNKFINFFLIGSHSMQGWTATTRHGVTGKRSTKRLQHDRKKGGVPLFDGKRSCLKRIRGYDTGEEGVGSSHSFAK